LSVRCIVLKYRSSSNLGVIDPAPSPHSPKCRVLLSHYEDVGVSHCVPTPVENQRMLGLFVNSLPVVYYVKQHISDSFHDACDKIEIDLFLSVVN